MCPRCGSNVLLIKHLVGFEKLLASITGTRAYRCRMCAANFRMVDRRRRTSAEAAATERRVSPSVEIR